jgi:tRNA (cytidine32/guanosine34-2'-O)-methyltransferase
MPSASANKLTSPRVEFNLFANVSRVVDLCAAPGSWSQVLSRVLIQNEQFGLKSWQNNEAHLRRSMLAVFPSDSDGPSIEPSLAAQHEASRPRDHVKIVSIDLQPISPLAGITTLQADITHPATVPLLLAALDEDYDAPGGGAEGKTSHPVDLVLSDGAPDVTGLHDLDIYVQSQLLFAALNLALCVLKPGGKFVAKIFRGRNVDVLYAQLKIFFEKVVVAKPRSSRASSMEAFIVCLNYRPPVGFTASLEEPLGVGQRLDQMVKERELQLPKVAPTIMQNSHTGAWNAGPEEIFCSGAHGEAAAAAITELELYDETDGPDMDGAGNTNSNVQGDRSTRWIAPFIACGDLSSFDSDASYLLPEDYVSLDPVQPPIAPPYKRAIELRAAQSKAVR